MKNLHKTIASIAKKLDEMEKRQDSVLMLSREIVRDCANAIKHLHTGALPEAKKLIAQIDAKAKKLSEIKDGFEGSAAIAFQEYVEVKSLIAILEEKPLPDFQALGIDHRQFLSGLADVVGELHRAMLIALRNKDRKKAEYLFDCMESIYDNLMVLKYSSSLVGSLKPKQDSIRGQVEKARGELLELK
ncbi:MAG: hypothetical protein QXR53_00795 [Candidatus Norongarragalinales archaeon]